MRPEDLSAAVLAGGFSRRMGSCKAELVLEGKTLAERQTDKLRQLGICDVMLSGYGRALPGCRNVTDVWPHRGPLSGSHACLLAAVNPACLVVSVDAPLVPPEALRKLIEAHPEEGRASITALVHGERTEPLIAVYDCALSPMAEQLLLSEKTAIMRLLDACPVQRIPWEGDEFLLSNCNTPEEFERIRISLS